ncbi:hypothetical protein [Streptomyces sp. NPDC004546]|uniref:hypothetical protein n=1 Tax=Streptomyces sp. NPDC004546 TaxID=3154282 RepID=UPI0033AAA2A7
MPRRWSLGVDRIQYDELDGDYDRLKKTAKAHELHEPGRAFKPGRCDRSSNAVASENANSPQKRGWRR